LGRIPRNLDGLDQRKTVEEMNPEIVRDKFIYGLINTWDQAKNIWEGVVNILGISEQIKIS